MKKHTSHRVSTDQAERLVAMTGELDAFERCLGVAAESPRIEASAALRLVSINRVATATPAWHRISGRTAALAAAALLALVAVPAWMIWTATGNPAPHSPMAERGSAPDRLEAEQMDATVINVANVAADSTMIDNCHHVIVALYPHTEHADADCPDCWCMERLPSTSVATMTGGTRGGGITLTDAQLLQLSLDRSCVDQPRRVILVNLSGPKASLPTCDTQAKNMALCVMDAATDSGRAGVSTCVPAGVEYRISSWDR